MKVWSSHEVLTAADLNGAFAEFTTYRAQRLLSPAIPAVCDIPNSCYVLGDSFIYRGGSSVTSGIYASEVYSPIHMVNMVAGMPLHFVGMDGVNGTGALALSPNNYGPGTSRLDAAVGSSAALVWVQLSVNDIQADYSYTDIRDAYAGILTALNAAGKVVLLTTPHPTGVIAATSARRDTWDRLIYWAQEIAPTTHNVISIPMHFQNLLSTAVDGTPDPQYMSDGAAPYVHPNTKGVFRLAQDIAPLLRSRLPSSWHTFSPIAGLLLNPLNVGTGGTLGSNVTGAVAANYGIRTTGNLGTVVASKVTRSNRVPGDWQQVVWTPTAAYQLLEFYQTGSAQALTSRYQIGDVVSLAFEFDVDTATGTNMGWPYVNLYFASSTGGYTQAQNFSVNPAQPGIGAGGWVGVANTQPVAIPPGTTGLYFSFGIVSGAAGAHTFRFGRSALINYSRD